MTTTPKGPREPDDRKMFNYRTSPEQWRRLRIAAAQRDLSVTELMNRWLSERLEQEEREQ